MGHLHSMCTSRGQPLPPPPHHQITLWDPPPELSRKFLCPSPWDHLTLFPRPQLPLLSNGVVEVGEHLPGKAPTPEEVTQHSYVTLGYLCLSLGLSFPGWTMGPLEELSDPRPL